MIQVQGLSKSFGKVKAVQNVSFSAPDGQITGLLGPNGAGKSTTLRMLYQDMLANFHAGQANSVLVITAGPHTDRTLDGPGLQDFIRASVDPAKPIAVNIIDFGADPDRATWETVAHLSGGSYQNLPTSASPDLTTVVNTFLS